jgi:hypothetical protein
VVRFLLETAPLELCFSFMAATGAINFQHSHQGNNRKSQMHRALAVVNRGLDVQWEMRGGEETWRKWQMRMRWEPLSVGKFVVHGCDPQKCGEFLR